MRARRRLLLHRRIPPRIEMDDRVRAGQIQARAARLQADEEKRNARVALEPVDLGLPLDRLAVEVAESEFRADFASSRSRCSTRTNWLKSSTRWPPSIASSISSKVRSSFAEGSCHTRFVVAARQQIEMAADLAQPQQRGQHRDPVAAFARLCPMLEDVAPALGEHRAVDFALLVGQFA